MGKLCRLIEQRLHLLDEVYCMRQSGVNLKCSFILPPRLNVEKAGIMGRAKGMDGEASGLRAARLQNTAQRFRCLSFAVQANMEASKKEHFHECSALYPVVPLPDQRQELGARFFFVAEAPQHG